MAVLCTKYSFIFLCQPRTGSKAISKTLIESGCKKVGDNLHNSYEYLLKEGEVTEGVTRIVTIRNPYDSLASQYQKICSRAQSWSEDREKYKWVWNSPVFSSVVLQYLDTPFDFATFLKIYYLPKGVVNNNSEWTKNADIVLRFENLQTDLNNALEKLGVENPPEILSVNRTENKKEYRDYYNEESRAIVERLTREDCEKFGYFF